MKIQGREVGSWLVIFVVFSSLLTGCGGPSKITASMTVHEIALSAASTKAGEITFHVKNESYQNESYQIVHNFVIIKTDLAADALPIGADRKVDEGQFEVLGKIENLAGGDSADLTVTLDAGHYVLICNLQDHYGAGMLADFTVTP